MKKIGKKVFKISMAILLIIAMLFITMPINEIMAITSNNLESHDFKDIENHWAKDKILSFKEKEYINGYSDDTFRPDEKITRAEYIVSINNILSLSVDAAESMDYFLDVDKGAWYADAINTMRHLGIVNGYPDDTFRPDDAITRFEAVAILFALLDIKEYYDEPLFDDFDAFPNWVKGKVNALAKTGKISGYDDHTFRGDNEITRAETVALLFNQETKLLVYNTLHSEVIEEDEIDSTSSGGSSGNHSSGGNGNTTGPLPFQYATPKLTALSANSGSIGEEITLYGSGLTNNDANLKLYFEGEKSGKQEIKYIKNENNQIVFLTAFGVVEDYDVFVESEGKVSNKLTFSGKPMDVVVDNNATTNMVDEVKSVRDATAHELGVVLSDGNFSSLLAVQNPQTQNNVNQAINELVGELNAIESNYNNLSQEEKDILNKFMSLDSIHESQGELSSAADLLSHSTTAEALDNIEEAVETIKQVRDKIESVRTAMRILIAAAHTGGALADVFGFGSGAALHSAAAAAQTVVETVLTPLIVTLDVIIFTLELMPTRAVGDSFESFIAEDNIGIDESFMSIKSILGDKRADNILEQDLNCLLSTTIALYADLKMLNAAGSNSLTSEEQQVVSLVFEASNISEKMQTAMDDTRAIVKIGLTDPMNFYINREQYRQYIARQRAFIKNAEDLIEAIDGYALMLIGANKLNQKLAYIKEQLIEASTIAVNNIEYDFNQNYDPALFAIPELEQAKYDKSGVIYINKPAKIKGRMDFSGEGEGMVQDHATGKVVEGFNDAIYRQDLDGFVTNGLEGVLFGILDYFIDFDVKLDDVEVKLKLESSDESILSGHWDNGKQVLVVTGHKPGHVEATLVADIEQVRNGKLKKENASITREFYVLSGDDTQPQASYLKGPRLDAVYNEEGMEQYEGYIGDIMKVKGLGFSTGVNYQNLYLGAIPGINDLGMTEFIKKQNYKEFEFEIPDSKSADMILRVGPDQDKTPTQMDKWPSNKIAFTVLPTETTYVHPTGIVGESWPVLGKGFSHYGNRNIGDFGGFKENHRISNPKAYEMPSYANNSSVVHDYHNRLNFIFPKGAIEGNFHVTTADIYDTEDILVKKSAFSEPLTLSGTREGIRPDYVLNEDTGDGVALWFDVNNSGGIQLLSAVASVSQGTLSDYGLVSDNIGGVSTMPDEAAIDYSDGDYAVAWVGKGDTTNDIFISTSTDGVNWDKTLNISNNRWSSNSPKIDMSDIDNDGDGDIVVVWTSNPLTENEDSRVLVAVVENGDNALINHGVTLVSTYDGSEPSVCVEEDVLAVTWSDAKRQGDYHKNIQLMTAELNGMAITNINKRAISNNQGVIDYNKNNYTNVTDSFKRHITASHSDVVIGKDSQTGEKICYVAWENIVPVGDRYEKDFTEDIYFRVVPFDSELEEIINISETVAQSQMPKLALDKDDTPTLTWIEIGKYEDEDINDYNGFKSEIYLARSFDKGKSFNKPYMKLDENDGSNRIGHIKISGANDADYGIIYQYEKDGKNEIRLVSTQGIDSVIENSVSNEAEKENARYILRTYDFDACDRRVLIPIAQPKGDVVISKEDGSDMMKIIRTNSAMGNISASPDGKYICYADEGLMVAEADGSHPIAIINPPTTDAVTDAYYSPSGEYIAFESMGEYTGYYGFGTGLAYTDKKGTIFGMVNGFKAESSRMPWTQIGGEDVIVSKDYDMWGFEHLDVGIRLNTPRTRETASIKANDAYTYPAVTSDGKYMVYQEGLLTENLVPDKEYNKYYKTGKIVLRDMDNDTERVLTEDGGFPIFSLDGSYVAYTTNDRENIEIKMVNDEQYTKVLDAYGYVLSHPTFNLDSTRLYFNAKEKIGSNIIAKYYDFSKDRTGNYGAYNGATGKLSLLNSTQSVLLADNTISVTEGESVNVNIKLLKQPTADVKVKVIASNDFEAVSDLTFNSSNWDDYQQITLTYIDSDTEDHGMRAQKVDYVLQSEDTYFELGFAAPTKVNLYDNDVKPTFGWQSSDVLRVTNIGKNMNIAWPVASQANEYRVYVKKVSSGRVIANERVNLNQREYQLDNIDLNEDYVIKVFAYDDEGNESVPLTATYRCSDTEDPVLEGEITLIKASESQLEISWPEATDNIEVASYTVKVNESYNGSTSETNYVITGLQADTLYTVKITAKDTSHNTGEDSSISKILRTKLGHPFVQGEGYIEEKFLYNGKHPMNRNWNGVSRYTGPSNIGIDYVLDQFTEGSPVIDETGDIYVVDQDKHLTRVQSDGTIVWTKDNTKVISELMLGEDGIYFVDEVMGLSLVNYESNSNGGTSLGWYYQPDIPNHPDIKVSEILAVDKYGNVIILLKDANDDQIQVINNKLETVKRTINVIDRKFYRMAPDGWLYGIDDDGYYIYGYDLYSEEASTYHSSNFMELVLEDIKHINVLEGMTKEGYLLAQIKDSNDEYFICVIDPKTGNIMYKINTDIQGVQSDVTVTADEKLYVTTYTGSLIAYDLSRKTTLWELPGKEIRYRPLVDADGKVYALSDSKIFYEINQTDGSIIKEEIMGLNVDFSLSSPIIANDAFYFINNGLVKCSSPVVAEIDIEEYKMVDEADTVLHVPVTLTGDIIGPRYVCYKTESVTALPTDRFNVRNDYEKANGYLTFTPDNKTQYIDITLYDDSNYENYESFNIILERPAGGATLLNDKCIIAIRDSQVQNKVGFTRSTMDAEERDGKVDIVVSREHLDWVSNNGFTVDYHIEGNPGEDGYIDQSGTLEFSETDLTKTIEVELINDDSFESGRSFKVIIDNPRFVDILENKESIDVMIQDDDYGIKANFDRTSDIHIKEEDTTCTVSIVIDEARTGAAIRVTASGNASYTDDYTTNPPTDQPLTLVFGENETRKDLEVTIIEDLVAESDKTIVLQLGNVKNSPIVAGAVDSVTIHIEDDDRVEATPPLAVPGRAGTKQVELYNIANDTTLKVYDASHNLVKTSSITGRDHWGIWNIPFGSGYYATQTVGGIESGPSNTFDIVDGNPQQMMETVGDMYSLATSQGTDGEGKTIANIEVTSPIQANRYIYFLQVDYNGIYLCDGDKLDQILANETFSVHPDKNGYTSPIDFERLEIPWAEPKEFYKIYIVEANGKEYDSEILRYQEVTIQ